MFFMQRILITLLNLLALISFLLPVRAEDRPNILFIAVDDLNDWVGHLGGHPQSKTGSVCSPVFYHPTLAFTGMGKRCVTRFRIR